MNWEAMGAIGEIGGAVAVVATLFYLAIQIRQNSASLDRANDYAQAQSVHNINSLYIHVFSTLAESDELSSIYSRALAGEELTQTESTRFKAFINTFVAWFEDIFFQQGHELGFSAESRSSVMDTTGPYVARLLTTQAGKTWWEEEAVHLFSAEFVSAVNAMLGKDCRDDA